MAFPTNIEKQHLLSAIEKIQKEGIPNDAQSRYYDVVYNNQRYPPKLIVSYANYFANGDILDRNSFSGGTGTPCFKLLEENDFTILEKGKPNEESFYHVLTKFLEQANKGDLKTSYYPKVFNGLKVKVSFGQGNTAKIPWISFLKDPNTTSNGIYPVYLYYRNLDKLILAFGISETNEPSSSWNLDAAETIYEYFTKNGFGKPARYGASYVFKVYDSGALPNKEAIDEDLEQIIDIYYQKNIEQKSPSTMEFNYNALVNAIKASGLFFSEKLILRFVASLCAKPFVILTGLSGSGKTKMAQAFVKWICEDEEQYCMVPVGSDWTNRDPLLGYTNSLQAEEYVKPENGVLDLLLRANRKPDVPYFLILDEMNLSHVERYFADFLSVMESKDYIPLRTDSVSNNGVPTKIKLPPNLFVIGTVNIDETTYMFSPKVLDRANTIEFRVTEQEMKNYFTNVSEIDMIRLNSRGSSMANSFLNLANNKLLNSNGASEINDTLLLFFQQLKKAGSEFGYRSAAELLELIGKLKAIEPEISVDEQIDIAVMQKLLPKLHGSRRKLSPILIVLGSFCITEEVKSIEKEIFEVEEFDFNDGSKVRFPLTLEKITRMYNGAVENGYASYAEA